MKKNKSIFRECKIPGLQKVLRTMKLTTFFLLISVISVVANKTYSQTKVLTLNMNNSTVKEVLQNIEEQSEFYFMYSEKLVDVNREVSVNIENQKIDEVLDGLFASTNVIHTVKDRFILLTTTEVFENDISAQQQNSITGKVTERSGQPLPGVTVVVKGTTQGTVTNTDGNYSLPNVPEDATLVFSFVGMRAQEVIVGSQTSLNVTMEVDAIGLEEVVAIGYGTQRKETLTGSVANVSNKVLAATPTTNVTNAIAGILPGVITKNTTGEPGRDDNTILIRGRNTTGNTSPLIVVDGIQDAPGWQRINTSDIESISVLKDASAAIYGARAANGVILITTKRGSIGKPTINYTFNQGISTPTRLPEMASSAVFADYVNQLDIEAGSTPRYSDEEIQKFRDGSDPNYINENWYASSLKKYTPLVQHNLAVRGGSESVKYSVSGSYSNEDGIFKNTNLNYKTYAIRSNIDAIINEYLSVGIDLNGQYEDANYPGGGSNFGSLKQIPFVPVFWRNGLPSAGIENGENPIIQASAASGVRNIDKTIFDVKGSFDLKIPWIEGLGVDGYYSFTKNITKDKNWQLPWQVYDYNKNTDIYTMKLGGGIVMPQLTQQHDDLKRSLINLRIKYELKTGGHYLNTFIAVEQSDGISSYFSAFRRNFLSNTIDELFAGSLVDQSTDGNRSESGRRNVFGRVSYNFQEKYLIDFNLRYDGSSNFPKGNQWGLFPGVSAAWRLSQEPFLSSFESLDNLKLRLSVGKIGNDAIAAFQNLRLYSLGNTGMSFGRTPIATQGLQQGVTPNPNITWEVATTYNIGIDAQFLDGFIGIETDVFKQRRSNILAQRDLAVPVFTGLILPNENIGIAENKGFEIQLSHSHVTTNKITYRVAANVSYSRSKIIDIDEAPNVPEWQKAEGHIIGADRYYQALGIIRTQEEFDAVAKYPGTRIGDLYYKDVDKNGIIDNNDIVRTDRTNMPEVIFGANLSLNYKDFSLWANFAGATRVWQYFHVNARVAMNQLEDVIINRYTEGSMDSKYPRLPTIETMTEPSGLSSTFWLMNASYLKLKTLEFSYNLPKRWLSIVKIQEMRLFVNGNNIFTLDKLKWNDPETTEIRNQNYPQQKVYNLGINLTF